MERERGEWEKNEVKGKRKKEKESIDEREGEKPMSSHDDARRYRFAYCTRPPAVALHKDSKGCWSWRIFRAAGTTALIWPHRWIPEVSYSVPQY